MSFKNGRCEGPAKQARLTLDKNEEHCTKDLNPAKSKGGVAPGKSHLRDDDNRRRRLELTETRVA